MVSEDDGGQSTRRRRSGVEKDQKGKTDSRVAKKMGGKHEDGRVDKARNSRHRQMVQEDTGLSIAI